MCAHISVHPDYVSVSVYVHRILHFYFQLIANIYFTSSKKAKKCLLKHGKHIPVCQILCRSIHIREAVYATFEVLKVIQHRSIYIFIQEGLVFILEAVSKSQINTPHRMPRHSSSL